MEQLVTIELFGRPYSFQAEIEIEAAQKIADSLVEEVTRVQHEQAGQSTESNRLAVMILAALNIANENYRLKTEQTDIFDRISEKTEKIIQVLDSELTQSTGSYSHNPAASDRPTGGDA